MNYKIADAQDRMKATKRYGLKFDRKFKYCVNSEIYDADIMLQRNMKHECKLSLKYFDGCFMPYLVKLI